MEKLICIEASLKKLTCIDNTHTHIYILNKILIKNKKNATVLYTSMFSTGVVTDFTDVDECIENPEICNGGVCKNLDGMYTCVCEGGLRPTRDRLSCEGESICCLPCSDSILHEQCVLALYSRLK